MITKYFEKSINNKLYYFLIQYYKIQKKYIVKEYYSDTSKNTIKIFENIKNRDTYIKKLINNIKSQKYIEVKGQNKKNKIKYVIKNSPLKKKSKKNTKKLSKKKSKTKMSSLSLFSNISIISPKNYTPKDTKDIILKKTQSKTEWVGNFSDLLFGIIYLLKKHKNVCVPFTHFYSVDPYNDLAIIYDCYLNNRNNPVYRIIYPSNILTFEFFDDINKCINKRFVIVPLSISPPSDCNISYSHANILIFDNKQKTVERFETYGNKKFRDQKYYDSFDNKFEKIVKKYLKYKYLRPKYICPIKGFQFIEENNIKKGLASMRENDPGGFCVAWSFWYADLRMTYPNIEQKKLQTKAIEIINNNPITFRKFIRNYAQFILDERKKIYIKIKKKYNIPDRILNEKGFIAPKEMDKQFSVNLKIYHNFIRKHLIKLINKYTK